MLFRSNPQGCVNCSQALITIIIMFDEIKPISKRCVPHEVHSFSVGSARTVGLVSLLGLSSFSEVPMLFKYCSVLIKYHTMTANCKKNDEC